MFARSLTWHPEASELWKQLTSSVDASPSPSPTAFWPLCFWPLGSRSEEALHFSIAGFVSSIVCVFPIEYLTAFFFQSNSHGRSSDTLAYSPLHIPVHHLAPFCCCVYFYYKSLSSRWGRTAFQGLAPVVHPLPSDGSPSAKACFKSILDIY